MKRLRILTTFFSLALVSGTPVAKAQTPAQLQEQRILAVAREIQAQQAAIAENQAKIDEKLATIAEYVRVARIYATRTGGAK